MRPAERQSGMTLVELILATTLTVVVAGGTVTIVRSVTEARSRAERQAELQQQSRAAITAIATALRNAYRLGGNDWVLEGEEGTLDDRPADHVRFFTVSHEKVRHSAPEGDMRECEFSLVQQEGRRLAFLSRRLDPTRNGEKDSGGVVQPIAGGIVSLAIEYFDGSSWQNEWKTMQKGWPVAARIVLTAADEKDPSTVWSATQLVNFPYPPTPDDLAAGSDQPTTAAPANTTAPLPDQPQPAPSGGTGNPDGGKS